MNICKLYINTHNIYHKNYVYEKISETSALEGSMGNWCSSAQGYTWTDAPSEPFCSERVDLGARSAGTPRSLRRGKGAGRQRGDEGVLVGINTWVERPNDSQTIAKLW